jgi:hypothetical protein
MQMTNADIKIWKRLSAPGYFHVEKGSIDVGLVRPELIDLIVLGAAAKGLSVYDVDREVFLTGDVGQLAGEPAE